MPNQVSAWGGVWCYCAVVQREMMMTLLSSLSHTARARTSFDIMMEPTMAADGHTYEKTAIVEWLSKSSQSPITGVAIDPSVLLPNHLVRSQIREHFSRCE